MESSDSGLPQELMSSEGDGGEVVSGTTTLMVTGLTSDHLAVATSTDEAVQQATIQAVLQAAGHTGERGKLYHKSCTTRGVHLVSPHTEEFCLLMYFSKSL